MLAHARQYPLVGNGSFIFAKSTCWLTRVLFSRVPACHDSNTLSLQPRGHARSKQIPTTQRKGAPAGDAAGFVHRGLTDCRTVARTTHRGTPRGGGARSHLRFTGLGLDGDKATERHAYCVALREHAPQPTGST